MKGSLCRIIVNQNTSPKQLNKEYAGKGRRHGASARRKKRGSRLGNAVLILIFLAGVGLLVYPTFSDWWNDLHQSGTGIMGYVNIPKIAVSLPIYHGTDPAVLEIAVGHIEGSSLPVGGKGTHCVISGHRGLPSAKLFTDIDRLNEGTLYGH